MAVIYYIVLWLLPYAFCKGLKIFSPFSFLVFGCNIFLFNHGFYNPILNVKIHCQTELIWLLQNLFSPLLKQCTLTNNCVSDAITIHIGFGWFLSFSLFFYVCLFFSHYHLILLLSPFIKNELFSHNISWLQFLPFPPPRSFPLTLSSGSTSFLSLSWENKQVSKG